MSTTTALTTPLPTVPPPPPSFYLVSSTLPHAEESHRIAYRVFGRDSAPHKLIFTMGLGGTTTAWDMQVRYFASKPELYQFVVYDNRGMGFSDSVSRRDGRRGMAG